jgi:ribosomal protein S27AE
MSMSAQAANFSLNSAWVWVVAPAPYALLAFMVWGVYQAADLKCPRCGTWLGSQAIAIGTGAAVPKCPRCGVSFDEPMAK